MSVLKPTIAELEAMMERGKNPEIRPDGEVVERAADDSPEPGRPEMAELTFTVRGSPAVLGRFVRLMMAMDLASNWGCSRTFGMPLDGDGPERFIVRDPAVRELRKRVRESLEQAVDPGRALVVAYNGSYSSFSMARPTMDGGLEVSR